METSKAKGAHPRRGSRRLSFIALWALWIMLWAGTALQSGPAFAQTASSTSDPGTIEQRLRQIEPPEPPSETPAVTAPSGLRPEAAPLSIPPFVLTGVTIEGAEALPPGRLAPLYEEFLAQNVGREELLEIVARITQAYIDAGYVLSYATIPPQQIRSGILRVQVIEGRITKVTVTGDEDLRGLARDYTKRIQQEAPTLLATLERDLVTLNSLPGITVAEAVLAPAEEAGSYELQLTLDYDRVDATAYLDNRGTRDVGRLQTVLSAGINSLAGTGERVQVSAATVPDEPEELQYFQLSYAQPLGNRGTSMALIADQSWIEPGGDLEAEDTEGQSTGLSLLLSHPLILSRSEALSVGATFDYRKVEEDRFGRSNFDDDLRVVRANGAYSKRDRWAGTNFLSAEVSQGLKILGASERSGSNRSRSDADGGFTKVEINASRAQDLWDAFSIQAGFQGQHAFDPLLSSEEFQLGGSRFGRAYDFGELGGEDGIAGAVELRYGEQTDAALITEYQFYGFYDAGRVWNRNAGGGESSESLSSAGVGVRVAHGSTAFADLELAAPISREPEDENSKSPRVFFSVTVRF